MISIADHLRQEGEVDALRRVLRTLLADRFGPLPANLSARVDALDSSTLSQCIRQAVSATRADDVFAAP